VAVHHILFYVMQAGGAPVFIFEEGHVTFSMLVVHALFALAEGGVLIMMTRRMYEEGVASEKLT
jgi:methyl-accepting chemotaxis protein